ncbi:hypothetical protein A3F08_02180 [Candidatus Berkelbacteria bacterium RIFCSPHIGHO2_12_FULL_36_9]|uniref:Acetate kinase n=1 Tax=Candidatus Berkelbacteria bacterium RIFCSPHIGHO2_12_FULL_36_9 TaxID=1797469 RepID=A0A1F5EGF8_9BACT|nr:MAG: hypothetical protein A3F08_02180 [Candidatus Berkelbacteria bacterium RIFCSPHIGHO2_12_FULL_36_9]
MNGKILVFNAGSTTLKYKLFNYQNNDLTVLKHGFVQNIGLRTGPKNHLVALSLLFSDLAANLPSLAHIDDLVAIGHRVVYGGNEFRTITKLDSFVVDKLKKYNSIAPLHNPPILDVITDILKHSGRKGHRDIDNYAVFDSSFFSNLPQHVKIYPLSYKLYRDNKIEKFGFHGISHQNVIEEIQKKYPSTHKIISIHLGSGSSITACIDGKPIDTSMGFTPREGLMMTTRSGDIDPGILIYLVQSKIVKNIDELDKIINELSGLQGVSEISSDMRDLLYVANLPMEDNDYKVNSNLKNLPDIYKEQAKLAIEMYCYKVQKFIGAYFAILGGCDVLVFTGAIGYGSNYIRNKITEPLQHMLGQTKIEYIETDEETQIAEEIINHVF